MEFNIANKSDNNMDSDNNLSHTKTFYYTEFYLGCRCSTSLYRQPAVVVPTVERHVAMHEIGGSICGGWERRRGEVGSGREKKIDGVDPQDECR